MPLNLSSCIICGPFAFQAFSVCEIECAIYKLSCNFLFGIFYSIVNNVNAVAHKLEEEVPITVFFQEDATEEQIEKVGEAIKGRPEVARVEYESAEEAWEYFSEFYFEGSEGAEGFKDDNPLVGSSNYQVYMNDITRQAELVEYVSGLDGVREVNQSKDAADMLGSINRLVSYISIAIIAVLLLISIFLISNTISVGISVRSEEIGIMKYIGATDGFVRAPFVLEGMVLGMIGAAVPLLLLFFGYNSAVKYILTKFSVFMGVVQFIPVWEIYKTLLPIGLALGIGIGFIGSIITTRKHLRV